MNANRRQFIGAGGLALATAGIGLAWAKTQSTAIFQPPFLSEGNLPSLKGATTWLNSQPLIPDDLRGRPVVIQFWTFTCVNWLRTLPYVRAWAEKYRNSGLVAIGVHTPEFSFEHNLDNVQQAARAMQVDYPIAVDNEYAVWDAFSNQYWPALYIADASGRIRHHHYGEGAYDESERVIQQLLADAGASGIAPEPVTADPRGGEVPADSDNLKSPETYLGSARSGSFASAGGVVRNSAHTYSVPTQLSLNHWALDGNWTIEDEPVTLNQPGGRIAYQFHARDLNLVMGRPSPGTPIGFHVLLDGAPPGSAHGFDVDEQGNGTVSEQRFYQLIRQPAPGSDRRFDIAFLDAGVAAYDFTFG